MADQSKFKEFAGKLPGIVGTGVSAISGVVNVFKRKPNVRAWSQAKRAEKRRLRTLGLSGSDLRQALRAWSANNPRPQGSEPYNPTALGTSNQSNPDAQAQIGTFAPLPNNLGARTAGSGLGFNPLWLLVAVPFVFPKQFKRLTSNLKF
jgi:hypothetical protein